MLLHKHSLKVSALAFAIALSGCGGSSSDSSDTPDIPDDQGRDGTAFNAFSMSAKGGSSILGDGGYGGEIEIDKTNSTTDLNIVKQGNIDTSYTLPAQTPEFGINPVTIETTQTILFAEDSQAPAAGTLYMVPGENRLFKSTGDKTAGHESHEVTGLTVNAGATLFLSSNDPNIIRLSFNNDVQDNSNTIRLLFNNDVNNDGVISTVNDSSNARASLSLTAAAYYGTGDIDLKGDTSNLYRQSGGDLELNAYTIITSGLINTSGANKSDNNSNGNGGGNAGSIDLNAAIFIETTGELRANGGFSDSDDGTNGADITLNATTVVNTGLINSNSGSGDSQSSGFNRSDISLIAAKSILNTGTISSKGADTGDDGNAGKGGAIEIYLDGYNSIGFNKSIINTGNLIVDGGSITGNSDDNAGDGGTIRIYTESPDEDDNVYSPVVFEISGNLSANGGSTIEDGSEAGNGGEIDITNYDNPSSSAETFIIGYNELNTSGGNGVDAGGAGDIDISFNYFRDERARNNYAPTVGGSIYNNVDLIANGGSTTAEAQAPGLEPIYGNGAGGGRVSLNAFSYAAYLQPGDINVTNEGTITVNGGNSYRDSSRNSAKGGSVLISASHTVSASQPIASNGGSDLHIAATNETNDHEGSNAGNITILSQYEGVSINTAITANGGSGDLRGGNGGFLNINANNAIAVDGSVSLNGASTLASSEDGLETKGGDAGYVSIVAESMDSQVNAIITADAGAGDELGQEKVIYVDADCLSNNCDIDAVILD